MEIDGKFMENLEHFLPVCVENPRRTHQFAFSIQRNQVIKTEIENFVAEKLKKKVQNKF